MKTLDSKVFETELDRKTLENLLETLDHITPKYISREEFNAKKWEILEKTWDDRFWDFYDLYLPEDLKVWELLSIIRRINRLTFWENLPEFASSEELKVKIVFTFEYLLDLLSKTEDWKERKSLQIALKKFYQLYADLFPWEENNLNDENYRKWILEKEKTQKQIDYEKKLYWIKTKTDLSELRDSIWEWLSINEKQIDIATEVEKIFSWELLTHFDEAFFEKWVNDIRFWLEITTQAEQQEIIRYCEENWYKKSKEISATVYKKWNDVIAIKDSNLEKEAKKLRDKIWVDKLKRELEDVRKTWDEEKIAEKELEVANIVAREIYNNFNYYADWNNYWYQIKKILETRQIYCVWFSIVWHVFLGELWIEHNWLDIPFWSVFPNWLTAPPKWLSTSGHSALEVIIWWERFLFDTAWYPYLKKFKTSTENFWMFERREVIGQTKDLYTSWDVERILLSQIYNNKWYILRNLWKYEQSIKASDKAIELNPCHSWAYHNKWVTLHKLKKTKLSKLYIYTSNLVKWMDTYFDIKYRKEKQKIRKFIQDRDSNWLRLYLLELEKEES